jgi:hypothetical protein
MKKSVLLSVVLWLGLISSSNILLAQGIRYQAVARDGSGLLMANTTINVEFIIYEGGTNEVYRESHNATSTNAYALFTLTIGKGTTSDNFEAIDWGAGDHFLEVKVDGASMGTTQLETVPYSKVATNMKVAQLTDVNISAVAVDDVLKWDGTEWTAAPDNDTQTLSLSGTDLMISNGNSVALGPIVNDADSDPTNEIQTLSKSGSTVTLSNGGGSFTDAVNDADANSSNELQTISKSGSTVTLSNGGGSFTDAVNDADASSTNEIQTLSLSGNTLSLSLGGGSASLPWMKLGNEIYYNAGNVGIGVTNPNFDLHLEGGSGNLFHIEYTGTTSSSDMIEMQAGSGFTGQFIEFQNSSGIILAQINADGRAVFETVTVEESLSSTAAPVEGRVYKDGLPLAYGFVAGTTLTSDFGVTSVTNPSTGVYVVTLNSAWSGVPVILVTTANFTPAVEVATVDYTYGTSAQFEVNISPGNSNFSFVVYGNP